MLTDTALRNLKPKSKFSHRELLPMLPRMTRHFFRLGMACLCIGLPLAALAKPPLTGEALYQKACAACHGVGPVEAPKFGDHAAWAELITEGQAVVTAHGWVGVREMPPRGGVPDLSLEAFGRAVAYMARAAGADWQDPELSASLLQAIRAEEKARRQALQAQAHTVADQGRSGAAVYEAICRHCHETGVAGAPAKGDGKAWRPLLREGQATLTAHAWLGVRAMPPRGGHDDLSLEEFSRAVADMAQAAGGDWRDPSADARLMRRIRAEIGKRERQLAK